MEYSEYEEVIEEEIESQVVTEEIEHEIEDNCINLDEEEDEENVIGQRSDRLRSGHQLDSSGDIDEDEDDDEGDEIGEEIDEGSHLRAGDESEDDDDQDFDVYSGGQKLDDVDDDDEDDEDDQEDDEEEDVEEEDSRAIPGTSSRVSGHHTSLSDASVSGKLAKGRRKKASDEDDDWLTALEEGRLHEVDEELKKMNDPKLMTARQRALLDSKAAKKEREELEATQLKSKSNEVHLDEATVQKNILKATKRRQQAEEKKEKDRKLTIERLLNKKDSSKPGGGKGRKKKPEIPKVSYINNRNGIFICFPSNVIPEFEGYSEYKCSKPLTLFQAGELSHRTCARQGCGNPRKYSCSKSGLPCCSLECYKVLEIA